MVASHRGWRVLSDSAGLSRGRGTRAFPANFLMAPSYQPAPAVHMPLLAVLLLRRSHKLRVVTPPQASPHPSPSLAPQSLTCSQIHGAFRAVPSRKSWGRLETLSRSALPQGRLGPSSAAFRNSGCHLSSCTAFSLLKVFFPRCKTCIPNFQKSITES